MPPGLLLALLPCCCLLPLAAPQSSQPAADEAQLLLQIKRAWGDPPVLAGWNASATGARCAWPYMTSRARAGQGSGGGSSSR